MCVCVEGGGAPWTARGARTGNPSLDSNSKIQIFRPKFEEELISRQSLNFVNATELNESFSDKLIIKLNSVISGEFENKQMLDERAAVVVAGRSFGHDFF